MTGMAQTIWIVRHSDRFDFDVGEDKWKEMSHETFLNDPVLSDLGTKMAFETAECLHEQCMADPTLPRPTKIITSPFVRCIQTANAFANKFDLPLQLDDSLFEVFFTDEVLPTAKERARYFPRIDTTYKSIFKPAVDETYPEGSITRYHDAGLGLAAKFPTDNIILVTHAGGVVAILASFLNCRIRDVPPAFPCGLFRLDFNAQLQKYELHGEFSGGVSYLKSTGRTLAWPDPASNPMWEGTLKFLNAGDTPSWLNSSNRTSSNISGAKRAMEEKEAPAAANTEGNRGEDSHKTKKSPVTKKRTMSDLK